MGKLFSGIIAIVTVTVFALCVITATADEEEVQLNCVRASTDDNTCPADAMAKILKNSSSLSQFKEIYVCLKDGNNKDDCVVRLGPQNTQKKSLLQCASFFIERPECISLIIKGKALNIYTPTEVDKSNDYLYRYYLLKNIILEASQSRP